MPAYELPSGRFMPVLGLGTWKLQGPLCVQTIEQALGMGYRHIDTAFLYQNHLDVKEGIFQFPRDELFITSKLPIDAMDPKLVESRCDVALKELGCDYLDLFLIHWPNREKPMSEIFYKMLRLKEKGKILDAGVCNCTKHHLEDLLKDGLQVAVNQVEFHPYLYQQSLLNFCQDNKICLTAYSPLARGKLTKDDVLSNIGLRYSKTANQVALRWIIQKGIPALPKASSEKHLQENRALFDFFLSDDEMEIIDRLEPVYRAVSPNYQDFEY